MELKILTEKKEDILILIIETEKYGNKLIFKKDLDENYKNQLSKAESYLLKVREEDTDRNEWLFKNRNNFFVKKMMNFYWNNN